MRSLPFALPALLALALPALPQAAAADEPDPRAELATAIVRGQLEQLYPLAEGGALRFRVEGVEKGRELREGQRLYARFAAQEELLTPKQAQPLRLFLSGDAQAGWSLLQGGVELAPEGQALDRAGPDLAALEALVGRLTEAAKVSDWKTFALEAKQLRLDDHEAWFTRVFGPTSGKRVAAEYVQRSKGLIVELRHTFEALFAEGGGPFEVYEAAAYQATGLQRRARFAMQVEVPLYTLRWPRAGVTVWSFAYIEGQWRWLGKLQALPREPLVLRVQLSHSAVDAQRLADYSLEVTIENASEESVDVPTVYDGRLIRLYGRGLGHLWTSQLEPAQPPVQRLTPLEPKARRTLLSISLDKVFSESPSWRWDWEAHPTPPLSPIHRWRELGLEPTAGVYVGAEAGRRTLHSKPARLVIKGGE